jgi:hypothetical protein
VSLVQSGLATMLDATGTEPALLAAPPTTRSGASSAIA